MYGVYGFIFIYRSIAVRSPVNGIITGKLPAAIAYAAYAVPVKRNAITSQLIEIETTFNKGPVAVE